ncbi:hypothetical protein [Streptomyces avicenniae]|uniref:hypothetical protein n=1 Tax=Streptomyces avicenniae TaxID=500153 RepID=UPI00069C4149|nr:hypothetical protein [Streptomyces avicenniae]
MDSGNTSREHDELAAELVALVRGRLLDPLEILLEEDPEELDVLRARVGTRARVWAARLLGDDSRAAAFTAMRLIGALYPGDGPFDPPAHWWGTALGRVVARRVGYPGVESVSLAVAGAMLGVTRQGVHDLVRRGKLDRHASGGVTTASVRARLDNNRAGNAPRRTEERK